MEARWNYPHPCKASLYINSTVLLLEVVGGNARGAGGDPELLASPYFNHLGVSLAPFFQPPSHAAQPPVAGNLPHARWPGWDVAGQFIFKLAVMAAAPSASFST